MSEHGASIPSTKKILLSSKSSAEALKALYEWRKLEDKRHTMQAICSQAGIASTGYFADVLSGKRILNKKYSSSITKALGLKGEQAQCLKLLLQRDLKRNDPQENDRLEKKLDIARRNLATHRIPTPKVNDLMFALEVFCAFGLFKNTPTKADLTRYFGRSKSRSIKSALETLQGIELIKVHESDPKRYDLVTNQILFAEAAGGGLTHVDFLKSALKKASTDVEHWFAKKNKSHFVSSIVSVQAKDFQRQLPQIKKSVLDMQSNLESSEADSLVRFNVQIYPVTPKDPD